MPVTFLLDKKIQPTNTDILINLINKLETRKIIQDIFSFFANPAREESNVPTSKSAEAKLVIIISSVK